MKQASRTAPPSGLSLRFTRRTALTGLLLMPLAATLAGKAAFAQSLDALRASGKVGERFDGYAQALSDDAAAAVKKVNGQRRQIYKKKAGEEGVTPDQVGMVYAKQIYKKLPAGAKFLTKEGKWITK